MSDPMNFAIGVCAVAACQARPPGDAMTDLDNFAIGVAAVACWQLVQDTRIANHEQMHRDLQRIQDRRDALRMGRSLETATDPRVWDVACDFAVNDNLTPVWDRGHGDPLLFIDELIASLPNYSAEAYYELLKGRPPIGSGKTLMTPALLGLVRGRRPYMVKSVWDPRDLSGSMSREALDIGLRKIALQVQPGDWWERKMEELMGRETWKTPAPLPCPSRLVAEALIGGATRGISEQENVYEQLRKLRGGWWAAEPGAMTYAAFFFGVKHELPGGQVVWLHGLPTSRWRKP